MVGTYAVFRVLTEATSVSVFALNITTALGFGLAVDYSLFIATRYREELDAGRTVTEAVAASLRSAGRTVLFSALPHTQRVDTAVGTFVGGGLAAPAGPASAAFGAGGGSWLSVVSDVDPGSSAGEAYARAVRALPAPAAVLVGGDAATQVDTKAMLSSRLPWMGAIMAVSMLVLLFLFSGSVVIPLKQLILNMLSLTASFGALVYVFQDGHLKWLVGDFVHTGRLEVTVPILMSCVAFGLSMDYSVFLLSRIREEYLATGDNTRAVAFGTARTGRLITAAALIVATVFGALATSELSILKLLGAGLALAVLVDATLVRGLLVPAAMRLLGEANRWAPAPLRRLHAKFGLTED